MIQSLKEIWNYRDMIGSLVRRELRGKYEKSVLGFLWAFLGPLFQILIYSIVFTVVFHNSMPNYTMFLMAGMLPWTFFSDSLAQGTSTIIGNSEMVKKIYFPREVLVISEVLAKMVNMLLSFIVMAVFLIVTGVGFSVQLAILPLAILIELIFTMGLSLIVSALTVYLRDLEYVINVVLMAWIWGTPIMYSIEGIDNAMYLKLLYINPMTAIINNYQCIFYYHIWPNTTSIVYPLIEGIIMLIIGDLIFIKCKKRFAEEM
jgi:ABC-2 type transport system permease protein